jgi:ankyrin repeat protein
LDIHVYAKRGDLTEVQRILGSAECREKLINAFDEAGMTPLMHAVSSPDARVEIVSFLLEGGAEVNIVSRTQFDSGRSALSFALGAGDPEKVALLLDSGADLHYKRDGGYDAVIDAVHGRDITRDAGLMGLLRLLVERGARVDGCTKYCESGVRVASNLGRFDAVKLLLDAGADAKKLDWTPLMHTIAFGTLAEVKRSLGASESLKARDSRTRTPWLLAIQTGSIAKAQLLLDRGADIDVRGHFGKPPLHHWLLGLFGYTAVR